MIQIILEGYDYSVHNAGSNTSIENIKLLIKPTFDIHLYVAGNVALQQLEIILTKLLRA